MFLSKVGTAVVTRDDGRLALGRLGALCEQVIIFKTHFPTILVILYTVFLIIGNFNVIVLVDFYENIYTMSWIVWINLWVMSLTQIQILNSQGFEVILVSSGAVGAGRQRLRYRKLVHSRYDSVISVCGGGASWFSVLTIY